MSRGKNILMKIRGWLSDKNVLNHLVFWAIMYLYYISSNWVYYADKLSLVEKFAWKMGVQIQLSYFIVYVLIPKVLNKGRKVLFAGSVLLSIYATFFVYTLVRYFIFDPRYPGVYKKFDLSEQLVDFNLYLNDLTWFIFPTIILVAIQYYKHQKEVVTLREQKKTTELNLLKNQLNPHFLFNTLNSLYVLSLKKSDRTPEVIGKLSAILDYMLYHCSDAFVPLTGEITLLNNYLALEDVRYGKRLKVDFDYTIGKNIKIAPLLMLTLVENAFKHGVKEEANQAALDIKLRATANEIVFELENTKPASTGASAKPSGAIGLQNIRKQLAILYPNKHTFEVKDSPKSFLVTLKLVPNAI
ncbi:histidine kinase [Flammeovirgaceae bacterium SG7u.111]|nr:histidine kinase [Flammeovirgaceae bacterium SG7u.132]WPO33310.1 histidine kinase [Flammeovirgaceae bacterium SG7u.111]